MPVVRGSAVNPSNLRWIVRFIHLVEPLEELLRHNTVRVLRPLFEILRFQICHQLDDVLFGSEAEVLS